VWSGAKPKDEPIDSIPAARTRGGEESDAETLTEGPLCVLGATREARG